jgi:hypothetical protein
MNNDLISREALKKTLCEEYEAREHYIGEIMLKAIDNAQTVEQHYVSDLPDDVIKTLQTLAIDYSDGIAVFERKRPQGEWKPISRPTNALYVVCPFCNEENPTRTNFCPNCGADMRKGGAEK